MNLSPKQVIDDIRALWSVGVSDRTLNHYRENLHNALERLSHDLYSKNTHFVLELIQNADDNAYGDRVVPRIVFAISKRSILTLNNEKGFEEKHVRSICSVGNSTKSRLLGYIGEKGIGFKSVFKITDEPHIFSNGFNFKFSVQDPSDPLGFVVPHWIDRPPRYATKRLTALFLPLKDEPDEVLRFFDELDPHLLLFLQKVRAVEMHNKVTGQHRLLEREEALNRAVLNTTTWGKSGRQEKGTKCYVVAQTTMEKPDEIVEPKRDHVSSTVVTLAFPVSNKGRPIGQPDNDVFAFLPIRQFGFRFIIQADFLVPANREDIHKGNEWNRWLRDSLSNAFCNSLPLFKNDPTLKHTFYVFLPRDGEVTDEFFRPAVDALYSDLNTMPCVETESGEWRLPANTLLADEAVRQLITNEELHQMTGLQYAHQRIKRGDVPSELGCGRFSLEHLFRCLRESRWVSERPAAWFALLYSFLAEHASSDEELGTIRQLPIFPLGNGDLASLDSGAIFLPERRRRRYEFESDIRVLRRDMLFSDDADPGSLKTSLLKLGLHPFSASAVIDIHILPLYQHSGWEQKTVAILQSHIVFIKDHLDIYIKEKRKDDQADGLDALRSTLRILSSSSDLLPAAELYLPNAFGAPYNLERLFKQSAGVQFVNTSYLGADSGGGQTASKGELRKSWAAFFVRLGVHVVPKLAAIEKPEYVSRRTTRWYTDYQLSNEIRSLLSENALIEEFLRILDASWSSYYKSKTHRRYSWGISQAESRFLAELRALPVPTFSGASHALGDCILNSAEVQNLFRSEVPILTVTLKNSEMIGDLGIAVEPTLRFVINQLHSLRNTSRYDFKVASKFYTFLHKRFDGNPSQICESFESEPLILAGEGDRIGFYPLENVCWRDLGPEAQTRRMPLQRYYDEHLREFFVNVGVAESPTIRDLAEVLKRLADQENPTASELNTVIAIYHDLNAHIATLNGSPDTDWLSELLGSSIFWTNKNEFWRNDRDLFLNDNEELFELFADSPLVAFLGIPRDDIPELESLADWAGIRAVSEAVSGSFLEAGKQVLETDLSQFLRSLLRPIARYLRFKMNKLYRKAQEGHLFDSLAAIECFLVEQLTVQYTLNQETRHSTRSSVLRGSKLYLSTTCTDKADAIAQEYANHIGGKDELANFISLVCTKEDIGSIEAFLDSRHIPQLSDDENRYFEDLNRAGANTFKPVSKGILSGEQQPETTAIAAAAGASAASPIPTPATTMSDGVDTFSESSAWIPEVTPTEAADAIVETFQPRDEVPTDELSSPISHIVSNRPESPEPADESTPEGDIKKTNHSYAIGHWGEEWVVWTHLKQKYAGIYGESAIEESTMGFDVRIPGGEIEVVWLNALGEQHQPYDVLIRENGVQHFVEVKSTSTEQTEWFDVSGNQWQLAIEAGARFSVYRVYRAGTSQPRLKIIDDLASRWSRHELEADPIRIKL